MRLHNLRRRAARSLQPECHFLQCLKLAGLPQCPVVTLQGVARYAARLASRTAARHPAIGAGGRTAARRVRMMKVSKPPASPPRRTAAAGADTCARAAEAAREAGAGSASGVRARRACRNVTVDRGGCKGGAWMHLQNQAAGAASLPEWPGGIDIYLPQRTGGHARWGKGSPQPGQLAGASLSIDSDSISESLTGLRIRVGPHRPGHVPARPRLCPAEAASLNKYTARPAPGSALSR